MRAKASQPWTGWGQFHILTWERMHRNTQLWSTKKEQGWGSSFLLEKRDDSHHAKHRRELLLALKEMCDLLGKEGYKWQTQEHAQFQAACEKCMKHCQYLAKEAVSNKEYLWSVVQKHHMCQHLCEQSKYIAPRHFHTYGSEGFMKTTKKLAGTCLHGTPAHKLPNAILIKYRFFWHLMLAGLIEEDWKSDCGLEQDKGKIGHGLESPFRVYKLEEIGHGLDSIYRYMKCSSKIGSPSKILLISRLIFMAPFYWFCVFFDWFIKNNFYWNFEKTKFDWKINIDWFFFLGCSGLIRSVSVWLGVRSGVSIVSRTLYANLDLLRTHRGLEERANARRRAVARKFWAIG